MLNNIESAEKYLNSFPSFQEKMNFGDVKKFDLERVRKLAEAFCPGYEKLKVVHVAGSKGKGSTSLYIAEYLRRIGFRVALFTSPYMKTVRESFWLNGEMISDENFCRLVGELKHFLGRNQLADLTYFEVLTVLVLRFFVEEKPDFVVVEVGLGGRLDATNIVHPVLTVLTRIELEHTNILGDKIEDVLREKLGIMKPGVPLVCGFQNAEVERLLPNSYRCEKGEWELLNLPIGQRENLLLAAMALRILLGDLSEELLLNVAENVCLPGRFERRLLQGKDVVFDMAHTERSFLNLLDGLKRFYPRKKYVFFLSLMRDKDVEKIAGTVNSVAAKIYLSESHPQRSLKLEELEKFFKGEANADCVRLFDKALKSLKKDQVLVVTGSHYLVSKLL